MSPVSAPSYLVFKGFVDYLTTSVVNLDSLNSLNPDPDPEFQVIPDTDLVTVPDPVPLKLFFIFDQ